MCQILVFRSFMWENSPNKRILVSWHNLNFLDGEYECGRWGKAEKFLQYIGEPVDEKDPEYKCRVWMSPLELEWMLPYITENRIRLIQTRNL